MNVTTPEAFFSASFSHFFPQHVKILGSLIIFVLKRKGKWTVVDSEKKNHLKWGLASTRIYSHDLTLCWLFQSRERRKKNIR